MPLDFPNPSVNTTYTDPTSGNTYIYANGSWSISNVLPASKGGTGFNTFTRGDILFGNASGTLSKLAAGTNGYVLSTNGSTADPTWIAMSTGGGAGTVAIPENQYQLAGYYQGTGASVSGSSTFTNNTASGIVSITHATGSTSPYLGALVVSGGVGIGGTLSFTKSQLGLGGTTTLPTMSFIGNTNNPVYLNVLENNSLSFEGYHGQLLSISPDLTSGYVFTVGDISGIPLLRANANANITANEYGGNFGIGTTNPGSKLEVAGNVNITGTAVTLFQSVANNYLYLNSGSNVIRIQTDAVNSRVRMFENMTTSGTLGFFGTSGGTLYLGTDSGTQNGNITIRGNNTSGGGGDQRAAIFTLATATSNGTGSGGTIVFQTSTSATASSNVSNIHRTRLRIEGAASGTSNYESIIVLGDTNSGTAWTSYLRGVDATGNNVDAGEIQIQAGRSTGTGNAQGISFYVSSNVAAASTLNTANQIARFNATGLTINPSSGSGSTTTGALIVTGGVGIGGSLNVYSISKFSDHLEIKGSGPKELRLYNSAGTEYTALKSAAVSSQNYTYTLPLTYGNTGEFLQTNGSGTLSWASVTSGVSSVNAGVGLSVSSSTGSVTVKNVRPVVLNLASGFTPVGIGTDYNILRVPEGKGNSSTNYYITKVVLGVGVTSSGTSTIRLEKSSGPHTSTLGFSLSSTASTFNVMSTDLSLLSGLGETSWTSFGSGYGTVATGDRVRLNFTAVDTAHSNFIVQMLLEEY